MHSGLLELEDKMKALATINLLIGVVFTICYLYQFVYIPLVWILKRKQKAPNCAKINNFAVLICARNEGEVVSDLIKSLKAQTYPEKLINIFVMADNCTDDTAETARRAGATAVYERENKVEVGKGYALDALLKAIKKDFPEGFDGYFVFDADNILKDNFIEQMNLTFSQGYDVVTSYRNSKNYGSNWISAGYALWFLRESRYLNQARTLLGTSCPVSGTGFLFSRELAEEIDGWPYHTLTEDIEFSVAQIIKGKKTGICAEAVLFDEQPEDFSQSWNQRLRWSKGFLQVFRKYGKELLAGVKGNFACYDMSMTIMPAYALGTLSLISNFIFGVYAAVSLEDMDIFIFSFGSTALSAYLLLFIVGLITTISEWKHICTSAARKIIFVFTFPIFMFTYYPISFVAIFAKTEWKPIKHSVSLQRLCVEGSFDMSKLESRKVS